MLQKGYYSFTKFNDEFDHLTNNIMKTFFFDKPYSLISINQEKRKHNFSTRHWQEIIKDDKAILCYDIHGLNPNDIKVTKTTEDGIAYIKIEGKTKNEVLDCDMEVNARWAIPYKQFKKPTKKVENGLLYIFVEQEFTEEEIEEI